MTSSYNWDTMTDHNPNDLDIIEVLRQGQLQLTLQGEQSELAKHNTLRGGSSGAIISNLVHGECHRKAHLRFLGIGYPLQASIELMTRQGEQNEEIWLKELRAGLPPGYQLLTQSDLELTWTVSGIHGSGSPDIAVAKADGTLTLGIENKNLSSFPKVKAVHYDLVPDDKHFIQAANYSLRLGDKHNKEPLPYILAYSSRVSWHLYTLGSKQKETVTKAGYDLNYKNGFPMSVKPFHRLYYVVWKDGYAGYVTHGMKSPVYTKINRESLDKYYEVVGQSIPKTKNLGPRPSTKKLDGSSGYSLCDYCEFARVCEEHESDYDAWLDHSRKLADDIMELRKQFQW